MTTRTRVVAGIIALMVLIIGYQYLLYLDLSIQLEEAASSNGQITADIANHELEIGDLVAFEAERLQQNAEAAAAIEKLQDELDFLNMVDQAIGINDPKYRTTACWSGGPYV